jgi:formylmethanofuran dehydrogenase subunit B
VVIDTGVAGIHEDGTAVRMDDVPLPVRAVVSGSAPATPSLIRDLRARVSRER